MSGKFYTKETPFQKLDCDVAFKGLTNKEKLYAHYLSRASWEGQFITMFQTSPESPLIFILLDKILRVKPSLKETTAHLQEKHGFSKDDVNALLVYAGAFFSNGGNYRGFGDSKFVPELDVTKVTAIAKEVLPEEGEFDFFNQHCIQPMMDYSDKIRSLGFPPKGITTYWSANCNAEDGKLVTAFLNYKKIDAYNNRVFKTAANTDGNTKDVFEIRFPSKQLTSDPDTTAEHLIGTEEEYKGKLFRFTRGDYSELMPAIIENLKSAMNNSLNDLERQMIEYYVKHFETGSLDAHKDASRQWIKDKGPIVESYIGFIETYRDPAGSRAEFEGFTAVVNKETSKKLGALVGHAEKFINSSLPWPKEFEKDSFLRPDFTALDIIAFAGSGVPSGINIPNYEEIRQNEGFKNVHLQNAIMANYAAAKVIFVSPEDAELLVKYREPAFGVQVGLHELLGHGSGKLFKVDEKGQANFDQEKTINPLTNKPVTSYYRSGETYNTIFTAMASTYEECRAECVGLYLSTLRDVLKVFGHEGEEANDVFYINWLMMILGGVRGLEAFNADTGEWGQAHSQARFVIFRVLLEEAKGLVDVQFTTNSEDKKPDLLITLNRSEIETTGRKAIGDFLLKLQVYKSTADIENARKMYMGYSEVKAASPSGHDFLKIREIVLDRKRPRTVLIQSNTRINAAGEVELLSYDSSAEGFAQSWLDRYSQPQPIYEALKTLYKKDLQYFPIKH